MRKYTVLFAIIATTNYVSFTALAQADKTKETKQAIQSLKIGDVSIAVPPPVKNYVELGNVKRKVMN